MDTNDLLLRWSTLTLDQIEDEIRDGKNLDSAAAILGEETIAEVTAVSYAPPAAGPREPVVLLPGIMGSTLASIRGVTSLIWINPLMFVKGNARYLGLDEHAGQDSCGEVEIVPTGLEKIAYLLAGIKLNREFELYEFPYDWRRPIEYNAEILHHSLERWAAGTDRKFSLVAHSMGGLVSRAYMALYPRAAEKRLKKLIMLGTPNFGATNAIETLFSGNSLMETVDHLNKANGMGAVVRSMPGIYYLLPAPSECFPAGKEYPADWDLYDAADWGVQGISQVHLDSARRFHNLLAGSDPQVEHIQIAGCHLDTLISVRRAGPALQNHRIAEGVNSGDGTVPLWSALLPRAGWFFIQEKHRDLAGNRRVLDAAAALIQGDPPGLDDQLPEPRSFFGDLSFSAPPAPTAAELEAKIRSGTATQEDISRLYFAL